jgi:ADP-ribose pyrophosphatase
MMGINLPLSYAFQTKSLYFTLGFLFYFFLETIRHAGDVPIPNDFNAFPEPAWRPPNLISATTVSSTAFARFEIHKVRTDSGEIVDDWLWTDERSHVNVLVHMKHEDKYLLFRQKKYGLTGPKLAVIGGLFESGETPEQCAGRELLEETGLSAEKMVNLGAYRVQVNRGGGVLHAFLAHNCVVSQKHRKSDDYEAQTRVLLDRPSLVERVLAGDVGEAQWVATAALGLLHVEHTPAE